MYYRLIQGLINFLIYTISKVNQVQVWINDKLKSFIQKTFKWYNLVFINSKKKTFSKKNIAIVDMQNYCTASVGFLNKPIFYLKLLFLIAKNTVYFKQAKVK